MRAVFGIVGLVVALAIVGLLASRQLKASRQVGQGVAVAMPASAASASPREQAQAVQRQLEGDIRRALEAGGPGAVARREEADQ